MHPTLCDPMDCSSPGSSVHGIFQARILELPFPPPGSPPDPVIKLTSLVSCTDKQSLPLSHLGSPWNRYTTVLLYDSKCGLLYPKYLSRIVSSFYRFHQALVHNFSQLFYYFNWSSYLHTSHFHQSNLFKKNLVLLFSNLKNVNTVLKLKVLKRT